MAATGPKALDARVMALSENTPEMLEKHKKVTNGKIRTRFPPEPNGYLHIGHAKSMHMNFCEAFDKLGIPQDKRETIFRYDDTNPEAESPEYIAAIRATIDWLGYSPVKTTYSSDYFDQLYELALKLIRKGRAYVCHQSKSEIEASRLALQQFHSSPGDKKAEDVPEECKSPYRSRSVEENLHEFEKMRIGYYGEGEASLRMKMELQSPNPNMWDHVAYRIKFLPHPHIGRKWCIYPTYDYTHCTVDALEHVDYSICTLEFETRRESYYWLLDQLDLFKPNVYEFARLSITHTVLSKRKLLKLVTSGTVRGWDDPRLGTLNGLCRRGFTPEIIKQFCKDIGVTRVQSNIQVERFHSVARRVLGDSSKRVMAVLEPIELEISNFADIPKADLDRSAPDYPQHPDKTDSHVVSLTKSVYVDVSDVKESDSADFFGLAPGKEVRLKYAFNFTCDSVESANGKIRKVIGRLDTSSETKPKGTISWVPSNSPSFEARVYHHLFKTPELPSGAEDWMQFVDTETSEKVYKQAKMDPASMKSVVDNEPVQIERFGYFVTDNVDSTDKRKVLNQIVALREASSLAVQHDNKGESRKQAQMEQLAAKMEKIKLAPEDMFRQSDAYSAFDATGLPTHGKDGTPLTKNQIKKLKKEQDKQRKLHESYLAGK